ncbi:hypothetical protein [Nodularia chucula]
MEDSDLCKHRTNILIEYYHPFLAGNGKLLGREILAEAENA